MAARGMIAMKLITKTPTFGTFAKLTAMPMGTNINNTLTQELNSVALNWDAAVNFCVSFPHIPDRVRAFFTSPSSSPSSSFLGLLTNGNFVVNLLLGFPSFSSQLATAATTVELSVVPESWLFSWSRLKSFTEGAPSTGDFPEADWEEEGIVSACLGCWKVSRVCDLRFSSMEGVSWLSERFMGGGRNPLSPSS